MIRATDCAAVAWVRHDSNDVVDDTDLAQQGVIDTVHVIRVFNEARLPLQQDGNLTFCGQSGLHL